MPRCRDPEVLARFWHAGAGEPQLYIDVNATTEISTPSSIASWDGARPADIGQTGEEPWHVLADPRAMSSVCSRTALNNPR